MTVIAPAPSMRVEPHVDGAHSFLVTRRERSSGRYERLGVLTEVSDGWDFRYFRDVFRNDRTIALPGIPLTDSVIHSEHLFPLFAQRVVSPPSSGSTPDPRNARTGRVGHGLRDPRPQRR